MKQGLSNVDVAALCQELDALVRGGRFDKAYQPAKDQVLLRLRGRTGRLDLLFQLGKYVTAVRRPPENPQQPSMVAKILRNTFGNGRLRAVRQIGFDRLLRIDVEKPDGVYGIVLELFGDGNMLLLGPDDTILLPMRGEDFAHRRLRKGEPYLPPPAGPHPLQMDVDAIMARGQDAKRDLVRFLALDMGLGPVWAEEVCLRSGRAKSEKPPAMERSAYEAVHAVLQDLASDIERNDLAPSVIFQEGEPVDAVPFPMRRYEGDAYAAEETATFREALDRFFRGDADDDDDDPRRPKFEAAKAKVQRQIDQMQSAMDGFVHEEDERRLDGDTLYAAFQEAQAILDTLQAAQQKSNWHQVAAVLARARDGGDEAAQKIPRLDPDKGLAIVRLSPVGEPVREVEIDLRLSVQDNANRHYEAAKKAKSRQEGAIKALEDAKTRLAAVEAKGLDGFGAAPKQAGPSRHYWFENYRWTLTPTGLLAVGGRNAGQNDAVVKKYMRDGDRYVHAEIHGAPSVVVRPADGAPRAISDEDLRAACHFAACSSRAWRQFGAASAYWVTPQQVSKTPRSGEFVPKGAWIVNGKRNVESDLAMEWCVGRIAFDRAGTPLPADAAPEAIAEAVAKLVGGPPECVEPFATEIVRLAPGDMDPNDAAQALAERFGVHMEEAQHVLPNGPIRFTAGMPEAAS